MQNIYTIVYPLNLYAKRNCLLISYSKETYLRGTYSYIYKLKFPSQCLFDFIHQNLQYSLEVF